MNAVDQSLLQRLEADQDGGFLRQLHAMFRMDMETISGDLREGIAPERYRKARALHAALECADRVVDAVWQRSHGRA